MNQKDTPDQLPRRGFLGGMLAGSAAVVLAPAEAAETAAAASPLLN